MSERRVLGFDRFVSLEWLDFVAGQVASGATNAEVREATFVLLDDVGGKRQDSARSKTVTVLTRIWSRVSEHALDLQADAVALLPRVAPTERVVLHWAMAMGCYPFFYDLAVVIGRMLRLQNDAAIATIARRMSELWGDRATLRRATRAVTRSVVAWQALRDTDQVGVYGAIEKPISARRDLARLLLHAVLLNTDSGTLGFNELLAHPALFPFRLDVGLSDIRQSDRFEVHRYGVNADVVSLVG